MWKEQAMGPDIWVTDAYLDLVGPDDTNLDAASSYCLSLKNTRGPGHSIFILRLGLR